MRSPRSSARFPARLLTRSPSHRPPRPASSRARGACARRGNRAAAAPRTAEQRRHGVQRAKKPGQNREKERDQAGQLDSKASSSCPGDLLRRPAANAAVQRIKRELEKNAPETVLDDFGDKGQITRIRPGPVVTLYELELRRHQDSRVSPSPTPSREP